MADCTDNARLGMLGKNLSERVGKCKVLVVGAGGIGCELLKNLVLTGFKDIEVIDLDTIDVSNLNRQFLFQKKHVGKSKAKVARESALRFNPHSNIIAHHNNVTSSEYGVNFFKQFDLVMNALDNRAARNHVNRMCLAADIPLIESGTAGYLGQATVIKKGLTECYECQPKPTQKTYPGCTIRNTPSEPIHCIVWAKHLFNQLFGEADADEEVSPDAEDPEAMADAGEKALQKEAETDAIGGVARQSTRQWAQDIGYDSVRLFNKLFCEDIKYLLSMDKLWKKRKPPTPLDWNSVTQDNGVNENGNSQSLLQDQRVWSVKECATTIAKSIETLKANLENKGEELVWDKDDPASMDFVTCAANIRSHIFGIRMKSRFDVKAMAGNIIPAIATTNAVIAAIIVMQGLNVLNDRLDKCKTIYLNRQPNPRKKLLVPCSLEAPNPKCYVCASKPEVTICANTETLTLKTLEDKILKERFGMVAPDVEIDDGKGTILVSSEEGETEEISCKFLSDFQITSGSRLKADDFLQNYELIINIKHTTELDTDVEFEIEGDEPVAPPEGKPEERSSHDVPPNDNTENDEVMLVEETTSRKRKPEEMDDVQEEEVRVKSKRARTDSDVNDDIIVL
ncbi:SUMO-activating enzyme subunit 2 isoform X2 [Exaiptasia diaphana]|uniref:SUMO-activating enzyme subunit n=1 Tax=Exaiptasia diaphana TaxID=2652724 RepID=A0A913YAR7_EXADI|nr:SUMO-activating enzyme subunit 2 isoform X2 [Exaiptasia diaphana]XP_020916844.1 SUMO-activating enzyme subunit 2 isoform X2 [Exaiptasia diaphana]